MSEIPPRRQWKVGTLVYTSGGLAVVFLWLLGGDFAWNLKQRAVDPVAQLLLKRNGATDLLVGLLIGSLPAALGMLLGPVIGVWSDRHRGRWGRRIPFLLIPTPFAVLSMLALAATPALGSWIHGQLGASSPGPQACALIAFSVFWLTFELATTVANTIFGALINDVVPTEWLGRFFGLFRAISLLAGIIFNLFLMGKAEEHFAAIFIGLAFVYGVGFTLMCLNVKEGNYGPPPPKAANPWRGLATYMRECYASSHYLWIFLAMALAMVAFAPINSFSVFYARSLDIPMDVYGRYLAITYGCSLVLSYFLGILADRFHPLRVGIAAMLLYAVAVGLGAVGITGEASFGVFFVLHGVLSGVYFTGAAALPQRLLPKASFAQFAAAGGVLTALFLVITPPAVGAFLDGIGHNYRYTFLISFILSVLAIGALLVVLRKVNKLGGLRNYTPPEG